MTNLATLVPKLAGHQVLVVGDVILDEYLIELGARWRLLRRMGLAYDEEKDEYERKRDQAVARDGGTAVLGLVPSSRTVFVGPYNVPDTGFGPIPP